MIKIIACVGKNWELGFNNDLCFRIPEDLKRFMDMTMNNVIVMGRKTYESIGRPLVKRDNIVISSQDIPGVHSVRSFEAALAKALELADSNKTIYMIGGTAVYAKAMEIADSIELTFVNRPAIADTYFPIDLIGEYEELKDSEMHSYNGLEYYFTTLNRINLK